MIRSKTGIAAILLCNNTTKVQPEQGVLVFCKTSQTGLKLEMCFECLFLHIAKGQGSIVKNCVFGMLNI